MNKVIIRSDRAGVFFGKLKSQSQCGDKLMVEMINCRRVFYWSGAASLSQLAVEGSKRQNECKITMPVDSIVVLGVIEIIPMTEEAVQNLDNIKAWKL